MSESSSSLGDNEDLRDLEQYTYIVYDSPNRAAVVPFLNEDTMLSFDPEVRMELSLSLTARPIGVRSGSSSERLQPSAAAFFRPARDSTPPNVSNAAPSSHQRSSRSSSSTLPRVVTIQQQEFVEEVRAPMGTHRFQVYRHVNVPLSASPRREPRSMYRSARYNGRSRSRSHHASHVNANLLTIGRRASLMSTPRNGEYPVGRQSVLHERSFSHTYGRTHQVNTSYPRSNVPHAPRLELHSRIHARHSRGHIHSIISRPLAGDPTVDAYTLTRNRRHFGRPLLGRDVFFELWPFARHFRSTDMSLPNLPGLDDNDTFDGMLHTRHPHVNRRLHTRSINPTTRTIRRARIQPAAPVIDIQNIRIQVPADPNGQQQNVTERIVTYSPPLTAYRQFHRDG